MAGDQGLYGDDGIMSVVSRHDLETRVTSLLKGADISAPIEEIIPMQAGGNNRTYCIETANARYAVKHYFQHGGDRRDRLHSEYAFLNYAEHAEIAAVPRPLAQNPHTGMALYEYIAGEAIQRGEVGQAEVDAAIAFFLALNEPAVRQEAEKLPAASEAAFSLQEHLDHIEHRTDQLQQIEARDEVDHEGVAFIQSIVMFWSHYRGRILEEVHRMGWLIDQPLAVDQRCISPSDFGFHNAIRMPRGEIRFIDFEYAGWDDPAKSIADFFCQPAVPVPLDYYSYFETKVLSMFEEPERLKLRTRLLWTAYQIKWCCITLNVFLSVHMERRRFANPQIDPLALKRDQLLKAQTLFQTIKDPSYGLH